MVGRADRKFSNVKGEGSKRNQMLWKGRLGLRKKLNVGRWVSLIETVYLKLNVRGRGDLQKLNFWGEGGQENVQPPTPSQQFS